MSDSESNSPTPGSPYRGNILLGTTLAFGLSAVLVVTIRIVFRTFRSKIGISDYCIGVAMVKSLHTTWRRRRETALDTEQSNANTFVS